MKAIAYHTFRDTDVLQTVAQATPSIKPNQVLVKVKAVSVNSMDWKIRNGEMKLMSGPKFPLSLFRNLFTAKKHVVLLSNPSAQVMKLLLQAINQGLHIEVAKAFPFSETKAAYRFAEKAATLARWLLKSIKSFQMLQLTRTVI